MKDVKTITNEITRDGSPDKQILSTQNKIASPNLSTYQNSQQYNKTMAFSTAKKTNSYLGLLQKKKNYYEKETKERLQHCKTSPKRTPLLTTQNISKSPHKDEKKEYYYHLSPNNTTGVAVKVGEEETNFTKSRLKYLYDVYCQYGFKMNTNNLKFSQAFKMFSDSDIIDDFFLKEDLEIIYKSLNKKDLFFEDFLQLIFKTALKKQELINKRIEIMQKEENEKILKIEYQDIIKSIVNNNLMNIHDKILSLGDKETIAYLNKDKPQTSISGIENSLNTSEVYTKKKIKDNPQNIPEYIYKNIITRELLNQPSKCLLDKIQEVPKCIGLIKSSIPLLFEIYKSYFSFIYDQNFEKNISQKSFLCKQSYVKFMNDFEISSVLISQNHLYFIFNKCFNEPLTKSTLDFYFSLLDEEILKKILFKFESSVFLNFIEGILRSVEIGFLKLMVANETFISNITENNKDLTCSKILEISFYDKLRLVLEKLEISNGIQNFRSRCYTTSNLKNSTFFPQDYEFCSGEIITSFINDLLENKSEEKDINLLKYNIRQSLITPGKNRNSTLSFIINNYDYIVGKYGDDLKLLFSYYCSYGENTNQNKMKSSKFYKFLKDSYLLCVDNNPSQSLNNSFDFEEKQKLKRKIKIAKITTNQGYYLKSNEVDTIFLKVIINDDQTQGQTSTINSSFNNKNKRKSNSSVNLNNLANETLENQNTSKNRRSSVTTSSAMTYENFINALELIAKTLFFDKDGKIGIDIIFENNISPLMNAVTTKLDSQYWRLNREKENDEEFLSALSLLYKASEKIFNYYSENGLMNQDMFLKFAKDFNIFPTLISKYKVINNFSKVSASLQDKSTIKTGVRMKTYFTSKETIDAEGFVDMIAVCSLEIEIQQLIDKPLNRLLFVIDKINESNGIEKIVLKTNNMSEYKQSEPSQLLIKFRDYFPNVETFKISDKKPTKLNSNEDFFGILES